MFWWQQTAQIDCSLKYHGKKWNNVWIDCYHAEDRQKRTVKNIKNKRKTLRGSEKHKDTEGQSSPKCHNLHFFGIRKPLQVWMHPYLNFRVKLKCNCIFFKIHYYLFGRNVLTDQQIKETVCCWFDEFHYFICLKSMLGSLKLESMQGDTRALQTWHSGMTKRILHLSFLIKLNWNLIKVQVTQPLYQNSMDAWYSRLVSNSWHYSVGSVLNYVSACQHEKS